MGLFDTLRALVRILESNTVRLFVQSRYRNPELVR